MSSPVRPVRPTEPGRPVAWLALLGVLGSALHLMGTGALASPPIRSLDALAAWAEGRDPATSAVALVRVGAELSAWYLFGLSLLHLAAARSRSRGVGRLADTVTAPGSRRLVHAGLGLGLLAATAGGADGTPAEEATARMRPLPAQVDDSAGAPVAEPGSAWMAPRPATSAPSGERTEPGEPDERGEPNGPGDPDTSPSAAAPASSGAVAAASTWRVERGESFWSIAADVLEDTWGRPVTDAEIDPFWRALVAHNRARLLDPADPDLIVAGQVFEVPAPAAMPRAAPTA